MVFSSYHFIFCFLPISVICYYGLSKVKNSIYQKCFLIFASLFFYGFYNVNYLFIIIMSIIVNYGVALLIQKHEGGVCKVCLSIGVLYNVLLLGYFKYYDFFVHNINSIFKTQFVLHHIMLPLGISFFTFQQISFLISVYKKEEKVEKFQDYCLFVSFFPQLIAGPIVLYSEMIPQFRNESNRYFNVDVFSSGIYIFTIGLFKKTVIADSLALFADNGFSLDNLCFATAWITAISYTLQIYFDFSGYSDMAVGLGKMFNIELPFNFLSPYKSESISEFWRRWHITLGRALSSYIYIPLGGNRKGNMRTCVNLLLTFIVSGLWHGASWTFVFWGIANGILVVFERLFNNLLSKIPKIFKIVTTFITVDCLWVLFRAENFANAVNIYKGMINFRNLGFQNLAVIAEDGLINFPASVDIIYILIILFILLYMVFCQDNSAIKLAKFFPNFKTVVISACLFSISLLCLSRESIFIYFNF